METFQVLIALDRPKGTSAIRATQLVAAPRIISIEETVFIPFQGELRPAFDKLDIEDEIFKLP
jgi:hypothetical protein